MRGKFCKHFKYFKNLISRNKNEKDQKNKTDKKDKKGDKKQQKEQSDKEDDEDYAQKCRKKNINLNIMMFLADQAIQKIKAISLYMKDFNKIILACQKEFPTIKKI